MIDQGLFDRQGESITFQQYAKLRLDHDYVKVASSKFSGVEVSTVWLGVDHGWGASERPVIFETMVFDEDGAPWDNYMTRYCTEREALDGHKQALDLVVTLLDNNLDDIVAMLRQGPDAP